MKKSDFNFDVDKYSLLFFNSLSERIKRLYAGLESMKLGYYGVDEVAKKFGMHKHTVRRGQKELLSEDLLPTGQVRRSGGGRKKKSIRH
jgi:predicted ArsR family transcriptional regulator